MQWGIDQQFYVMGFMCAAGAWVQLERGYPYLDIRTGGEVVLDKDLERVEARTEIWLRQGARIRLRVTKARSSGATRERGRCPLPQREGRSWRRVTRQAPICRPRDSRRASVTSRALEDVDVDVFEGEMLAIVGDNGAGKSTLIKILSGVHQPDRGELEVGGQPIRIADPHAARELGIATVFQNLALVDMRDVAANLYLGREPVRWRFFVDRKKMLAGRARR